MAELRVSSVTTSDLTNALTAYAIDSMSPDGISNSNETRWSNPHFTKWFGYYKQIPELKIAVDALVEWTLGKGYIAEDDKVKAILDRISGCGIDTFEEILANMLTMAHVNGDSYAQIIRDKPTGILLNLIVLDPQNVDVVFRDNGLIKGYELRNPQGKKTITELKPTEVFHLTNKKVANEIHGTSDIEAVEQIILANSEAFEDARIVSHRFAVPVRIIEVETDDTTEMARLKTKYETMIKNREVLLVPKGSTTITTEQGANNSVQNIMSWREALKNAFFQALGVPQVAVGGATGQTEANSKIVYLTFQQKVEREQRKTERAVWNQLRYHINLPFPATIQNELISDSAKDANQGMELQPSDASTGAV